MRSITTAIKPGERREKKYKIRIVVHAGTVDFTVQEVIIKLFSNEIKHLIYINWKYQFQINIENLGISGSSGIKICCLLLSSISLVGSPSFTLNAYYTGFIQCTYIYNMLITQGITYMTLRPWGHFTLIPRQVLIILKLQSNSNIIK